MKKMNRILLALSVLFALAFNAHAQNDRMSGPHQGQYCWFYIHPGVNTDTKSIIGRPENDKDNFCTLFVESKDAQSDIQKQLTDRARFYITGNRDGVYREDMLVIAPSYTPPFRWSTTFQFTNSDVVRIITKNAGQQQWLTEFRLHQDASKTGLRVFPDMKWENATCQVYSGGYDKVVNKGTIEIEKKKDKKDKNNAEKNFQGRWSDVLTLLEKCAEISGGKVVIGEEEISFLESMQNGRHNEVLTDKDDDILRQILLYNVPKINFADGSDFAGRKDNPTYREVTNIFDLMGEIRDNDR